MGRSRCLRKARAPPPQRLSARPGHAPRGFANSKGLIEPWTASKERAPESKADAKTSSAPNRAESARAVDTCVPLSRAKPSFGPSTKGSNPTSAMASTPFTILPSAVRASPSPMRTLARCARGAKSPDAPTDPFAGIQGVIPALNSASSASTSAGRTPECPRAKLTIFVANTKRTTARARYSPVPAQCDSTRLRCSSARWVLLMRSVASLPKPVLIP